MLHKLYKFFFRLFYPILKYFKTNKQPFEKPTIVLKLTGDPQKELYNVEAILSNFDDDIQVRFYDGNKLYNVRIELPYLLFENPLSRFTMNKKRIVVAKVFSVIGDTKHVPITKAKIEILQGVDK